MSTFGEGTRFMSVKPQSITDLAEVWDDLTPIQQKFMIQRARGLSGYNKMKAMCVQFKTLHSGVHEAPATQTETRSTED